MHPQLYENCFSPYRQLFVWFLFTGIMLDCLIFNEAPPTLSTRTANQVWKVSLPSLADLEFVNERNSQRIWKGRQSGSHSSREVAADRCSSFWTTSTSSQVSITVTGCGGSNNVHELWLLSSPQASVLSPQGPLLQPYSGCPSRLLLAIYSHTCGIPNSHTKFLILITLQKFYFPD